MGRILIFLQGVLMQEQLELCTEMAAVRSRGLANADELADRVEKLADWREHVRAHPLPIALAVATAAFWIVPRKARASVSGTGTAATPGKPGAGQVVSAPQDARVAGAAGLGGAAMGFLGSLIGNAVRSYVSEQVQTMITTRGNHATSQQRQASSSRF